MTNAATINENVFINSSAELMKAMADDAAIRAAATMDEAYEAFRKYVDISRAEFSKLVPYGLEVSEDCLIQEYSGKMELTDEQLDMVAGGFSFGAIWNKVKSTASNVWNKTPSWVKGAVVAAAVAGIVVIGIAVPAIGATVLTSVMCGSTAAAGAATGAALMAPIAIVGVGSAALMGGISGAVFPKDW